MNDVSPIIHQWDVPTARILENLGFARIGHKSVICTIW